MCGREKIRRRAQGKHGTQSTSQTGGRPSKNTIQFTGKPFFLSFSLSLVLCLSRSLSYSSPINARCDNADTRSRLEEIHTPAASGQKEKIIKLTRTNHHSNTVKRSILKPVAAKDAKPKHTWQMWTVGRKQAAELLTRCGLTTPSQHALSSYNKKTTHQSAVVKVLHMHTHKETQVLRKAAAKQELCITLQRVLNHRMDTRFAFQTQDKDGMVYNLTQDVLLLLRAVMRRRVVFDLNGREVDTFSTMATLHKHKLTAFQWRLLSSLVVETHESSGRSNTKTQTRRRNTDTGVAVHG